MTDEADAGGVVTVEISRQVVELARMIAKAAGAGRVTDRKLIEAAVVAQGAATLNRVKADQRAALERALASVSSGVVH